MNEEEGSKSKDIIMILQKKLIKDNQVKSKQNNEKQNSERMFLFAVKNLNDSLKRKKIMESL